jgi:recombination protein RecT
MGYAYLIPYYNKGKKECQFQIGYKGLVQLVRNSGEISTLKAETVYEKDIFSYSLGLHADLTHIPFTPTPEDMDRGEPIAYYAYYKTRDGDFDFVVAYKPEMLAFRDQYVKKDRNGNIPLASPWNKNFDEMAKKTLIKRVLKLAPLSPMIQERVQSDSTIKSMNFSDHMMDANALFSMNDETVYDAEFEEAEPLEITPNGAFQEEAVSEGA